MLLQLSYIPPPLFPCTLYTPSHLNSPFGSCPWVIYMFFGFYISYTLLNLLLSIFFLPFMLLVLCTFSPIPSIHYPTDNLLCDLHVYDSVPVLVVCLVCFCFCRLSCEFVVILLFIVLIFFFLDRSL